MGYGHHQVEELRATIDAADCDVVVAGTPIDFGRVVHTRHPVRQARYELREICSPTLDEVLNPLVERARKQAAAAVTPA
jgi:predicted GTPase